MTKRMKFKCTLMSDLIISQTSSTEGNQKTLDFIPGNNFLGIVAGSLYDKDKLTNEQQLAIFHSGKVRFGDANPSAEGIRGLKCLLLCITLSLVLLVKSALFII